MNDDLLEGLEPDTGVMIDDPTPAGKDPQKQHSWTRLKTYETCPFLYKSIYPDKRKGELNPIMIVGRVVHEAVAIYNDHCIKMKVTSDHEKHKEFAWQAIENSNLPAEYYDEVFEMVKSYADSHEVDLESVVGAEEKLAVNRKFEQVPWDDPDVWFRAILDYVQISGHIAKITDYKTGWAMVTDPFQLDIYAWMIKKIYPQVTDIQIEVDYLRHEFQKTWTISDEDMPRIEKKLLTATRRIEKDKKFEPNVGIQCSYCPMWYCCPAMKAKDIPFKMPGSAKDAVALALELEKLARMASEAKKVLRTYVDKHGALEAGGRLFEFRASVKYEFDDVNELLVALDKEGVSLLDYVNVNYKKIKTLFSNAIIADLVKQLGTKHISVQFTSTKAKTPKKAVTDEA